MVVVAQLVRALDCGSRGRRFEPGLPPKKARNAGFFYSLRVICYSLGALSTTGLFSRFATSRRV
jgi:hypothetical protein